MTELSLDNVREQARDFEEEHQEPIRKVIAVLIMTVTVLVAATAFFETRAGNREALAQRVEQLATIESMATGVAADRNLSEQYVTGSMSAELINLANQPRFVSPYESDLETAYGNAQRTVQCDNAALFGGRYRKAGCIFDYWRFYEDQQRLPALAAAKATAAAQADRGWGGQRGRFVTDITIFAVSLFLIGLTLTVPPTARKPFLWLGSFAGVVGLVWGIVILATPVSSPSQKSIAAFADGTAALNTAESETSDHVVRAQVLATYHRAAASLNSAIALGEKGVDAYIDRGDVYLELDLLNPKGPQGSQRSSADFALAARIDPGNYIAWGDLGAAKFWLRDYVGALNATDKALSLHNGDPVFDMNEALYDDVLGRTAAYHERIARLRQRFEHIPAWLRSLAVGLYETPIIDVEAYRPAIAKREEVFDQDLHSIADSITVAEADYGRPVAPRSPAKVTYGGFRTAQTQMAITFGFSGMKPGMKFLDYVYVDNTALPPFGPENWSKIDGSHATATLPLNITRAAGFPAGTHVLAEIFIDGDLRIAKEFVVP